MNNILLERRIFKEKKKQSLFETRFKKPKLSVEQFPRLLRRATNFQNFGRKQAISLWIIN